MHKILFPVQNTLITVEIHMKGKAEVWFNSYVQSRKEISWGEFVIDLCARFKDDIHSRLVEEFNKLQQGGSLEDYVDKFEELRALLLHKQTTMPERYFLESFIGGLKPRLKPFVRAFQPTSLAEAIEYV